MEPILGTVQAFAFPDDRSPIGWLRCDGRTVKVADHPELFTLLGTRYGGDGIDTFALPDLSEASERDAVAYHIAISGDYPRWSEES